LFGHLAPNHLLYVDAALEGKAVGTPAGRPGGVAAAELPGHSDTTAWPFVVLWALALLIGSVVTVWLWHRVGSWRTWLISAPVLFAVLWGLGTEALRLLPNVY
jgi:hypothetical protein